MMEPSAIDLREIVRRDCSKIDSLNVCAEDRARWNDLHSESDRGLITNETAAALANYWDRVTVSTADVAAGWAASLEGNASRNVEPEPSRDSTSIRPPCASTTARAMDSPSPTPEALRDRSLV